jgi:asparagine synthetase B (glutamine-hydrolysing)
MIAGERDPHGLRRLYYRPELPCHSPSLFRLLRLAPGPREVDPEGVRVFLDGRTDPELTCAAGVRSVPPGHCLEWAGGRWQTSPRPLPAAAARPLRAVLEDALGRALSGGRTALALSGGLDSALLLALARRLGMPATVYVLDARLSGYSEVERARATAETLGVPVTVVAVSEGDFVAALPQCVRDAEVPFYNLHPVSKHLLARRLRADGIRAVVTGDGADQVFAGAPGLDYLPLVGALFEAEGVEVRPPFLDDEVIALARSLGPDPDKRALRALARGLVPDEVVRASKVPGLAPPLDLSSLWDAQHVEAVARLAGRTPATSDDRARVRWTTLGLFRRALVEEL